jgi:hypothetical protein
VASGERLSGREAAICLGRIEVEDGELVIRAL